MLRLGLGLHTRITRTLRRVQQRRRQRARIPLARRSVERLHIGSGPLVREGWTNVDLEHFPGVDVVLDVRDGLPFRDARYIFAEHFLEHLSYDAGLRFLKECRAAMLEEGVLRLSTPNLDWVWLTQYRLPHDHAAALRDCFAMNKAFRGWGHQFLYNLTTLTETLHAAGFADVIPRKYGQSDDPFLTDLERHDKSEDTESLPHVIVVEARGRRVATELPRELLDDYDDALRS